MRSLGLIGTMVLVAIGIFLITYYPNPDPKNAVPLGDIGVDILAVMVLAGVGAFGGYLSAIQLNPADPRENSNSFRRAVLQGAAGAIIVVTLTPVDPNIVNGLFVRSTDHPHPHVVIKLIALALIGGYAGGALLESSAHQFAKKINDIEEKQKTLEDEQEKESEPLIWQKKLSMV